MSSNPLASLIQCGTRLWLDSVDPDLIRENRKWGATGATSNPIIISDLIKTGRYDNQLQILIEKEADATAVAWQLTDAIVSAAQSAFKSVWNDSRGDDGYVSFELDSLLEDPARDLPHDLRVQRYIDEGIYWSEHRVNRMIKVPATPAGLDALEELAACGVPLNVTLVFSQRQYEAARDAIWRGARRLKSLDRFKSVYSIFVSRIDVYTEKHAPKLSPRAQGVVGILNAQRIWAANQKFWKDNPCPLRQEIVFASTGTKKTSDAAWKYVAALAGSDIQTNPPATNAAVASSNLEFKRTVDQLPSKEIQDEIDRVVNFDHLETTLMAEGIDKFVAPQSALIELIEQKRLQHAN